MRKTGHIKTFKELFDEFAYSYDLGVSPHKLRKDNGAFYYNNLCITPTEVTYKMEAWTLEPGLFEKFDQFYNLLNS